MGKFVLKRLLALIPTILIIVFVVYFILDLTPSDPGHLILGQMASEEAVAAKNAELGYDKPFTVRYAKYIWDLCHGSLGNSWLSGKGVFETVMARFPVTVTLAAGATLIGVVIGVALGVDDAQRAGIITETDISSGLREFLGQTTRERLNTFVHDVIENSMDKPSIQMSPAVEQALMDLRQEMFQKVYLNPIAKKEESKAIKMLTELYQYYIDHPEAMSREYLALIEKRGVPKSRAVCDWLSGMTDQYSMKKFKEIFIPRAWEVY